MIPVLIGATFSLALASGRVLIASGSAGMGYGLGRKYGRQACEILDNFDSRIKLALSHDSVAKAFEK